MARSNKESQIVKQGAILAFASIIVRIIGLIYRIPMTRILGDEGMGYYSNAFNIYSFLLIISSHGMPSAIAKLVAERQAKKKKKEVQMIFKTSIILNLIIALIFGTILYYLAIPYSNFIKVPNSFRAIRTLVPALVCFALMTSFRGFFQGMNTMIPTAISQIFEQVFNAIFTIIFALLWIEKGIPYSAAGGTLGTAVGAGAGLLFLFLIYLIYNSKIPKSSKPSRRQLAKNFKKYSSLILRTGIPIIIGAATFHLTNIIDDIMFQRALAYHTYTSIDISILNGILNGKYKILITLPISIASAMATASIPSLSFSMAKQDYDLVSQKIRLAIKTVILIALPSAVGIFVLASPILHLLFNMDLYVNTTINILRIGSISIIFFSISTISIGMLQGIDRLNVPVKSAIKSMLIKIFFNVILLYVFDFNLYGAVITNIIFAISSTYFNMSAIKKDIRLYTDYVNSLFKPILASLIMGLVTYITYFVLSRIFVNIGIWLPTLTTIFVSVFSYFIIVLKMKILSVEELEGMPFGNRLKRLAIRMKLLK